MFLLHPEPLKICQVFIYKMPKTKIYISLTFLLLFLSACNAPTAPATALASTADVEIIPTLTPVNIPLTEAEVPRVTLEDAKAAFDNGTAIFVDVRSRDAYKAGHSPDALIIQLGEFETRVAKIKLPKDQWIITYCT